MAWRTPQSDPLSVRVPLVLVLIFLTGSHLVALEAALDSMLGSGVVVLGVGSGGQCSAGNRTACESGLWHSEFPLQPLEGPFDPHRCPFLLRQGDLSLTSSSALILGSRCPAIGQ